jgi:hypothetical protein
LNCVILQPSYIPWRGYFHQIYKADTFVFLDDVQYDKRGWRNRNRIKTANGSLWLTIPTHNRGTQVNHTPITEIKIDSEIDWVKKHLLSIRYSYAKAPFFKQYFPIIEELFHDVPESLADFTIETTIKLAKELGIADRRFLRSSDYQIEGVKTERLINLLKAVGATHYISGPVAKDYIEDVSFQEADISLEYMTYSYPEYTQLFPPFDPQVSIIDLLFMKGADASKYIWGNGID